MSDSFVGRDVELAALTDLCRRVEQGRRAAAAIVVGDPGSGKSRLIAELLARANGFSVLMVVGYEPERGVPMAAARDLLRRLANVPTDGKIIAGVINGTEAPVSGGMPRVDDVRVFEAAYRALTRLMPTLVVVDDLQWVDPASTGLCHYLFRASRVGGRPLALIACGRPGREVHAFTASLARVSGSQLSELTLGSLDRAAGLEFVAARAPGLSRAVAEDIWRRADGSPFWMDRLLGRGGAADPDALVASLARSMSSDGASLLSCLVAAGRPIEAEDVRGLLGWRETRLAAATDELLGVGLASQEGGTLRFVHDLIREAAARRVPSRRLARMHRSLATWLESAAGGDIQGLLESLQHRQSAGLSSTDLALRLVRRPNRHFLGRPGLERLMEIADSCDVSDPSCRPLQRAVAGFADELGAHEQALMRWTAIARTDEVSAAGSGAGPAWLAASRTAVELGRREEAWGHLERARAAGHSSLSFRVELETQRSSILRSLERRAEAARDAADQAVREGRSLASAAGGVTRMGEEERHALLMALLASSDAALMVDDPDAMLTSADELAIVAEGVDDRVRVQALVSGALALRLGGHNADAERRLARAWDEARRLVLPQAILEAGSLRGNVLLSLGRIEEASAVSRECQALDARLDRFRPARAFSVLLLHLIELSAGDWRAAVAGLEAAAADEPDPHYRLHARLARAAALARLDPRRGARDVVLEVKSALRDAGQSGCTRCQGEVLTRGSEALARVGRVTRAGHLARTAQASPRAAADRAMLLWGLRASAMLAVASEHADAPRLLEATVVEAEAQDLILEALWGRLDQGAYLATRDRELAAELLRRAGADAEAIGARTESRVAEQLLRSLGVRTWRRGRSGRATSGLGSMTDREREVARLAASGASNPEIAATLFLSRKTVERHLSNALARLGVRNRAELAALVGGEDEGSDGDPDD